MSGFGIVGVLCFLQLLTVLVQCSPDGAPTIACQTLEPQHGGNVHAQSGHGTFELKAETNDGILTITLSSTESKKFKGFIIQPRSVDESDKIIDGTFTAGSNSKTIDCFDKKANTLTHKSSDEKSKVSATWKPEKSITGKFVFNATVVIEKTIYYINIVSDALEL
ncbi:putative ferric-chelate reductase 1-like protein, partial [Leptotrombidium deliense]